MFVLSINLSNQLNIPEPSPNLIFKFIVLYILHVFPSQHSIYNFYPQFGLVILEYGGR